MYNLLLRHSDIHSPGIEMYHSILSGVAPDVYNTVTFCKYTHIDDVIIPPGIKSLILVQPWLTDDQFDEIISDIHAMPDLPVVLDYLSEHDVYCKSMLSRLQEATNNKVVILLGVNKPRDPGVFYIIAQRYMSTNLYDTGLIHTKIKCLSGKTYAGRVALTHDLSKMLSSQDFMYSMNACGWEHDPRQEDAQYLVNTWGYTDAQADDIVKFGGTRVILDSDENNRISGQYPNSLNCDFVVHAETLTVDRVFVTEKTYKCFFTRTPFLVLSQFGFLKHLRSIGFKTFDGIIDETYDTMLDPGDRLRAIVAETVRLVESPDYKHKVEQCRAICEHNFNQMNNPTILRQFSNNLLENISDSLNK